MSYDFHIEVDAGGPEPITAFEWHGLTYNLREMLQEAFGDHMGIHLLENLSGETCIPMLKDAVAQMTSDPARFRALNPPNGWGDYDGCLKCLTTLLEYCARAPEGVFRIT